MQDEERLVRRAQQEPEAFAQIYEEYFDKIYRYIVIRIGSEAEAEDLTQQVFLNALKSISSFKWRGVPFSAWLYRIAHNQVVDHLRKKTKHATESLDGMVKAVVSDDNPQMELERKVEIEQVLLATERLTKAQREVISLRFASELSVAEAARVMGKSEGAIKALQHSAIVTLRKALISESENG